jgi:hypothetical protein
VARELTPAEVRELLAVYALDAVDDEERAQIEEHLERVPEARRELDELRETAALLALSDQGRAPDEVWTRIEHALGAEPPRLVLPLERPSRRETRGSRRGVAAKIAIGIAAASAVAAGVTVFVVDDEMSRQGHRLDQVAASVSHEGMRRAAEAAAANPEARTLRLDASSGRAGAMVVTMPGGDSFLMAHGIPRLGPGRTYQLWAMTGDATAPTMVSAGVLGRWFELASFHAPEGAHGFMVTEERGSGAVHAHSEPLLEGHFA